MKTLEEIKKEYQNYKIKTLVIHNPEEFTTYAEIKKDDVDDDITYAKRTMGYNNMQEKGMKLIGYVVPFLSDDVEYYQRDNEILQDALSVAARWKEYYTILQECVDEEQLKEWTRLLDFTVDYYEHNMDYLESRRNDLDLAFRGIDSFNPKFENSRKPFNQFFVESIELLSPKKDIQKIKEI